MKKAMAEYYSKAQLLESGIYIWCDMTNLENLLGEIPAENILHITRCKNCEHSKLLKDNENEKHIFRHCRMMNVFVTDNSFCSYGTPN